MGSLFGGGGGAPAPAPVYVAPPAPGTLVQTILSGSPNPNAMVAGTPETDAERQRRLQLQQFNILGGGSGGSDAGGDGTGSASGGAGNAGGTGGGSDGGGSAP